MAASLSKRLERELKTNPKKAGILGVLALVAVYFWAPLVSGWFGKGSAAIPTPTAPPQTGVAANSETEPPKTTEKPAATWQQLVAAIDRDFRMQSQPNLVLPRDPFAMPVAAPEVIVTEPIVESKAEKIEITPQMAGLTLSSTIVGPRKRVALLSGKAYRLGDTILSRLEDDDTEFVLTDIQARKIVLRRDGKSYELKLNPLKLTNTTATAASDTDDLTAEPAAN